MADSSIVDPGSSSYSLPKPDPAKIGDVPQMPMERVLPRQQSTGNARGTTQLGSPNVYVDSSNEQIVVAKTDTANVTTPQVLMGNQANKGEGFFVTKPGINVTTASNDADFIFNSNQNVFKIVKSDTVTLPGFTLASGEYSAGSSVTVNHDLGYIPGVIAYFDYSAGSDSLFSPFTNYQIITAVVSSPLQIDTDSYGIGITTTQVRFSHDTNIWTDAVPVETGTWSPVNIKYYLLQESAN